MRSMSDISTGTKTRLFFGVFGNPRKTPVIGKIDELDIDLEEISRPHLKLYINRNPDIQTNAVTDGGFLIYKGRPFELEKGTKLSDLSHSNCSCYLKSLDGRFSLLAYDANRILISTDLIGASAVYYYADNHCLYFSTHLGLLLALCPFLRQFDDVGLASIIMTRGQVDASSHIQGVSRLSASSYLSAELQGPDRTVGLEKRAYLDLKATLFARRDIIGRPGELGDLIRQAVAREPYPDRRTLMLSGGRDSRALAFAMRDSGLLCDAVSYGSPDSFDIRRSRKVARAFGIQQRIVPSDTWFFGSYQRPIIGLNAGCTGLEAANNAVAFDFCRSDTDLATVGFLGDALTGGHFGAGDRVDLPAAADLILSNGRPIDIDVDKIFPESAPDVRGKIEHLYNSETDLLPHQKLIYLDLTIRQATWISTMLDICEWFVEISTPFFYRPLMTYLCSLQASDLDGQRLYDEWLSGKAEEIGFREPSRPNVIVRKFRNRLDRLRYGRKAVHRWYWPEISARSEPWISRHAESGHRKLDQITATSLRFSQQNQINYLPTFTQSIPLGLSVPKSGQQKRRDAA